MCPRTSLSLILRRAACAVCWQTGARPMPAIIFIIRAGANRRPLSPCLSKPCAIELEPDMSRIKVRFGAQAVWKRHEVKGPGGFRVDRYCFRILKLGDFGDGDASVHRWRRSDATGAATAQPGGLRRWGEPGSGDRGLHRRTGPGRLGIFRGDAGGDGPAGLPPLDAAEDLPLWLPQPRAVEPAAGTRSAA